MHKAVLTILLSIVPFLLMQAQEGSAIAPKFLYDPSHPDSVKIGSECDQVSFVPANGGLSVNVKVGPKGYPGLTIKPKSALVWDLSPWGRVQTKVTNTGKSKIGVNLRVDNEGPWQDNPWNCESVWLKPGESRVLKVIFGFQYGFKPGYKLKPDAVTGLLIFLNKPGTDSSFLIEDFQASGAAGEKPPVDPNAVVTVPAGGVILAKGLKNPLKVTAKDGARAAILENSVVRIDLPAGKSGSAVVAPKMGSWNLCEHHQVQVVVRNSGKTAVTPVARVESRSGSTDNVNAEEPLAPGRETTLVLSFVPEKPWVGVTEIKGAYNAGMRGTGSRFDNIKATGLSIHAEKPSADAQLEVLSIKAAAPPVTLPEWVGKRPPVKGEWKLTLSDEFDADSINLSLWNIYTHNYWDKRTHFTKDNTILRDGNLLLHYEKKSGFHNDDPNDKKTVGKTDFACGFASTYGKWTQRYGYFEARMKLPTCPGLWPAFWMMPDRGKELGSQGKRCDTGNGGMEYDIMEHLTVWGPYRFNMALHWDGYGKGHKSVGSSNAYVPADAEGFRTIGMLWTPGSIVYYGNGIEIGRWEHERISAEQAYIIFYMVSGGWANSPLDESQLPADFVIDYIRVWQRNDLATPKDGSKPNDGGPRSMF